MYVYECQMIIMCIIWRMNETENERKKTHNSFKI